MKWACCYCGSDFEIANAALNRARNKGLNVYCDRKCAGLGRRRGKTKEQKVKDKADYDKQFRVKNKSRLKKSKHEYFKRTYNKEQAALVRKANMHRHVEYCRRPEYVKWKKEYDKRYRTRKEYGEFSEAALVLFNLEIELENLVIPTNNHIINNAQKRKRTWQQLKRQ